MRATVAFYISRPRLRPRLAADRDRQRARAPAARRRDPAAHDRGALAARTHARRSRSCSLHRPCDTGVVQIDSLRLDARRRSTRPRTFYATFDARVGRGGGAAPRRTTCAFVVADAPPLGCAGGGRAPASRRWSSRTSPGTGSTREYRERAGVGARIDPADPGGLRAGRRGLAAADARRVRVRSRPSSTSRSSRDTRGTRAAETRARARPAARSPARPRRRSAATA